MAVGGDGTVADLINAEPRVPLTVLRAGTENLFAHYFGLPGRPGALAEVIRHGRIGPLDLGRAAGRRFALMAGFGFDADVVTRHHRARSGPTAPAPHAPRRLHCAGASGKLGLSFSALDVQILDPGAEETLTGATAFVFNLPRYALGLPFAPAASGTDGLLDLVVFRDPGPWRALHYLWLVFCNAHLHRPGVFHRRVRKVLISAPRWCPCSSTATPPAGWRRGSPGASRSCRTPSRS